MQVPARGGSSGRPWLGLLVVLAVVFGVHRGALDHDFVAWDDDINLYENPNLLYGEIRWALPWVEPYQGMWIPVTYTVWGAIAAATREQVALNDYALAPAPFHAANLALHFASTALVFFLLLRWLPGSATRRVLAASLGALLFGVHPIQVEAVHWATALKDTLSGFLAIASLAVVPVLPRRLGWRLPVAWLFFALALAAKPSVVVVPLLWLCFASARSDDAVGDDGRPGRWAWVHLAALVSLACAAVGIARAAQPPEPAATAFGLLERVSVALDSLGFYLGRLVAPRDFCPDYGRTPEWVLEQGATAALVAGGVYAALVGWAALRGRWRMAALLFAFAAALAPVLGLVPFAHQRISTVTDRYAYLAILAPACWLARALVLPRVGRAWPLAAGFLFLCAWIAVGVGESWRSSVAMWENVLRVHPGSGTAWVNLGHRHEVAGRDDEAIRHYVRAVESEPGNALAHDNIGNIHFRAGRLEEAEAAYRRAREANPHDLHARNNLGAIHHRRGDLDVAEALFEEVVATNSRFAPAHHNLALVAVDRDDLERAERHFRAALEVDPGYRKAHRGLARVLAAGGEDDVARRHLTLAVSLEEGEAAFELAWAELLESAERGADDVRDARVTAFRRGWREPEFLVQLGRGLLASERTAVAEEVLREAIARSPDRIDPRLDLATLLERDERWDEYRDLMVEAARDFPFLPAPWHNLAVYHLQDGEVEKAEDAVRTALRLRPDFASSLRLAEQLGIEPDAQ